MDSFLSNEKYLSQIPALQLLVNLGFEYLTPAQALAARGGKASNVLLEEILRAQLKHFNRIHYKGGTYRFSEENIQSAIQRLKNVKYDGLQKTNEAVYDLLTLGVSLEQSIEGDLKSFTLNFVDWKNPANNTFHVTAEFPVERTRSHETVRPDIVLPQADLRAVLDKPLSEKTKAGLFDLIASEFGIGERQEEYLTKRTLTEQDKTLYALCRPERLLEMALLYTVFDGGIRKIARYQQYFAVKKILQRVKEQDEDGKRRGGIVWHTQGSGKSLTMVMLARALALDPQIRNPRVVLVTDRVDLDTQLGNTFAACGLSPDRAESGRHLLELVSDQKAHIVTTLIHKFDKALSVRKFKDDSADIFMLVDESHRTNFGSFAARMRQMFPRACYLGFTGTPLMKEQKNNFVRFGGLIDAYSIDQAVRDNAVVPLLYEARHVEMEQNEKAIDLWFERHTQGLTDAQKADLKKKYSRAEMLNKADQVIYMRAFDISEHYRQHWQGTGFKAQLVAPSKAAALRYKQFLDDIGHVSSEVIISPPDVREGFEETDADESTDAVVAFWQRMMKRYGNEEEYNKQLINQFKFGDDPEILIVVDKLLTGFDAPRNTVLYLTRMLRDHSLLQAIARVNRLYDDDEGTKPKEFGYVIDYAGVLGELDKALTAYSALKEFEEDDLKGALVSIHEEVKQLPQRHAEVWDLFKEVKHQHDEEAYEVLLADEKLRNDFYERLNAYARTLAIALSSEQFVVSTPEKKVQAYKNDLRRFQNLKAAVKLRYADVIDYRDFEPKIKKLLDTHITASEVIRLNEPVNIFDEEAFQKVVEEHGYAKTPGAKADMIAHATKRAISERLEQDPAFYEKFSRLIQQAIDDFRARRISDLEYLRRVSAIKDAVVRRKSDDLPPSLANNENAAAVFGVVKPYVAHHIGDEQTALAVAAAAAVNIWEIIQRNRKVGFWDDLDAQRRTINDIDDYLYDELKGVKGITLGTEEMDDIIARTMQLARHRIPA
ncbi:MAG: type I restriction endonuclease subunit R [Deltaproteobacteria bacterium]|nr:type I restriction endonuclease subunit R [Deltaproteobacteria bacterium]